MERKIDQPAWQGGVASRPETLRCGPVNIGQQPASDQTETHTNSRQLRGLSIRHDHDLQPEPPPSPHGPQVCHIGSHWQFSSGPRWALQQAPNLLKSPGNVCHCFRGKARCWRKLQSNHGICLSRLIRRRVPTSHVFQALGLPMLLRQGFNRPS